MATWISGETCHGISQEVAGKGPLRDLEDPPGPCGTACEDGFMELSHWWSGRIFEKPMISWRVTMLWVTMFQYGTPYGTPSSDIIRHHPKCPWWGLDGEFHELTSKMGCWSSKNWLDESSHFDQAIFQAAWILVPDPQGDFSDWNHPGFLFSLGFSEWFWLVRFQSSTVKSLKSHVYLVWIHHVALKPTSPPTFFLRCNSRSFSRNLWRSVSCGRTTMRGGLKPKKNRTLQKRTHNP